MQLIGLTGGIAAGKSTIAARLAEHGAHVIDADAVAREVVEPGEAALQAIAERFGHHLVVDGALDRAALGAVVFADEVARRELEAIIHPAVQRRVALRIHELTATDPEPIIVYDVPLLVEARLPTEFDLIVVAHAPQELRVERLVELRGLARAEARNRVLSQASDAERLAVADVVIDTSRTIDETISQTDELWARLQRGTHSS